ncbi:MAG TPA: hypothetical protein VH599_13955 [Ktedonobacterales bacterium]|jgi:hypothetical protein
MAKRRYLIPFLLVVVFLAGPSSSVFSFSPPPADRLEVARFIVPASNPNYLPPGGWTVGDPATAQQIEHAVVALPPSPDGVRFCPLDRGVRYRLTFFAQGITLFQAVADAGNCFALHLDNSETRQTDEAFWLLLSRALGLPLEGGIFLDGPAPLPSP